MAAWSTGIRACKTTWTSLRILKQNDLIFDDSGTVRMDQLTYWNPLATTENRLLEAAALAKELDNVFRAVRGAVLEDNVELKDAIEELKDILANAEQTIADLAETADKNYKFFGEDRDQ